MTLRRFSWMWFLLAAVAAPALAADPKEPAYTNPQETDEDFAFQGEYAGEVQTDEGTKKFGVQVIALGDGKFDAVAYPGGLPGAGWTGDDKHKASGAREGDRVVVRGEHGSKGVIDGKQLEIIGESGKVMGALPKVARKSPTLGAKPPEGAIVLFDGSSTEHFPGAKKTEDGLLIPAATSKEKFGAHKLHLEFLLPYMPKSRGQGRANSGMYVQGRYEVQVLDSFGLEGRDNECGGIYTVAEPEVNMCLPPLAWQTYDLEYTPGEFDASGKKTKDAVVTILLNGVPVHNKLAIAKGTPGGPLSGEGPEKGPLFLQDHGNPVRFRNIWVVEQ